MSWPRWLDPAPHWLWWLPAIAMGVLVALAVVIPTVAYRDGELAGISTPDRESARESVDWVKFRPLWRQVVEAQAAEGAEPDADVVVIGRTFFGVEVVRLWYVDGDSPWRSETDYRAGLLALVVTVGGALLLGWLASIALWRSE